MLSQDRVAWLPCGRADRLLGRLVGRPDHRCQDLRVGQEEPPVAGLEAHVGDADVDDRALERPGQRA